MISCHGRPPSSGAPPPAPMPRSHPVASARRSPLRLPAGRTAALIAVALAPAACRLPTVNVGTPEPIKIDPVEIRMRVDVYQHDGAPPTEDEQQRDAAAAVDRQRNRMAEIQELKNNRFVGENHRGLLTIRDLPGGDYGDYVKKTVEAENEDRLFLMRAEARRRDALLSEIQEEQWRARVRDSFKGEWIEVAGEQDGTYDWVRKPSSEGA